MPVMVYIWSIQFENYHGEGHDKEPYQKSMINNICCDPDV